MLTMQTATYLGPATVTQVEGRRNHVQVRLPEEEPVWARMALAIPHQPAVGDQLLVIRLEGESPFVIGVLREGKDATVRLPGSLNLEAPDGAIHLSSPHVRIRAGKLELTAQRIIEKARDVYRWVSGLFQVKSRRMRTVVETDFHVRAEQAYLKTRGNMNIDGKSINLG